MHEVSIMESILETVFTHPEVVASKRVTAVGIKIGSLSSVVEDALRFAFDSLIIGTKAESASMTVEHVTTLCRCNLCEYTYNPVPPGYVCPECEGQDVTIINGRELQITSVEVDE